jgi:hypothetical protein
VDKKPTFMNLKVNKKDGINFHEEYVMTHSTLVVGNLMMGERYIEP